MSAAAPAIEIPADQVGRMFVDQYYVILGNSRELMYRLYQEGSLFARPGADGSMEYTSTIDGIKEKILSMDYLAYEIKTVDSQYSLGGGVVVLVTGDAMRGDDFKRAFSQTFFLAPQEVGFYVLNDIFRYIGEDDHKGLNVMENGGGMPQTPEHVAPLEPQVKIPEPVEDTQAVGGAGKEVFIVSENVHGSVAEKESGSDGTHAVQNSSEATVVETVPVNVSQEMPKKSFASIVKDIKVHAFAPAPVRAPIRPAPTKTEKRFNPSNISASAIDVPALNSDAAENGNKDIFNQKEGDKKKFEADRHSIHVRNLPFDATPTQVEEEFKKFGPIKPGGIQIRSNKIQGFCYGFVEFEVASAVQSAVEASPVLIGGRQSRVEEKKAGPQAGPRGRFAFNGGGGTRNDGMRGRGNYGGGRGYGKNDYGTKPEHGGRVGGTADHSN